MRKINKWLLFPFYLFLLMGCEAEKEKNNSTDNLAIRIDSLIESRNKQDLFHGGIVISQKGNIIYENYIGIADRSWNIPIQRDVKFDIASINKSMISALVLKAVEQDKLKLTDRLVDLLEGFSFEGNFHPAITLHQMLSHTAGLADYDALAEDLKANGFLKFKRLRFTNEEYVDFISKIKPINDPGKQFYYSNFAYHLLAIILEDTYQKPFREILKEQLTEPLGLKNTVAESRNERIILKLASAYNYQEDTKEWHENPFIDLSLGRRIFSTAADLQRWAMMMDNPGYLSEQSLELMQCNHLEGISENVSYGYGWVVFDSENKTQMGNLQIEKPYIIHGGSTDGYKAMLININEGEYIISFLSNVGNRTQEMQMAQDILKLLNL